ncbi:MAG TPA: phospholipase D family protein [Steroidobacteraceae bacterium]|nr:phospholipase D family protein [Steroidobacteraceae bacterium]
MVRVQSARHATQSLDVQTYIWHADLTGAYLGQVLLEAADRGVRVRLLLDDLDARAKNDGFAALAAHPHIDVRMFNPWVTRNGTLAKAGEGALSFKRINRRMHNKSWIADNRLAVVGGRNVGDEYFGAGEAMNFLDLDFAMLGPVVRDVSANFDRYWNSSSAYPMEVLDPDAVNEPALEKLRKRLAARAEQAKGSRYAIALEGSDVVRRMIAGNWPVQWTSKYQFVSDDPAKVTMKKRDVKRTHVGVSLAPMVQAARERVAVISPYFVPGEELTASFTQMVAAGKSVRVLTNSLVANDVAAVHGGYSRYRKTLLKGGVQLWELKPAGEDGKSSLFGSSGASLHTKAFAVDGEKLFVGSYNLDPRSTWLNCEQGVLVENSILARELESSFDEQIGGDHAWRVSLEDGGLHWSDGRQSFDNDPKATAWQRFQAWATRVLRLDAQL